jgi:hypothetical protein
MRFSRPLIVLALLLLLLVVTVGLATAVSDSIGGLAFHPYTMDGSNSTCVPWNEPATGATRNCDPVNLLFLGMDVVTVQAALTGQGWSTTSIGTIQQIHFADESDLVDQDAQMAHGGLFNRYHIRLWQTPDGTSTLAAVHHESGYFQHTIDADWEAAETFVHDQFCGISLSCSSSAGLTQQVTIQATDYDGDGDTSTWRTWTNDGMVTILQVSEPPPPQPQMLLAIVVSTDKASYTNKDSALVTVDVSDAATGSPIGAADVGLVVDSPSGRSWTADGTTNGDGSVTFKYRINTRRSGTGTYTASATAAAAGYEPASGKTSFEVTP